MSGLGTRLVFNMGASSGFKTLVKACMCRIAVREYYYEKTNDFRN